VIRHFHGHLSGIYASVLHPSLDLLFTAGRDAVIRVWDIRSRQQVMCLEGHSSAVWNMAAQKADPQIISVAGDATVRLWDVAAGKCHSVLTHHKKGVRGLALSRQEFSFVSGSPDNIKKFLLPEGQFVQNLSGHSSIINSLALNDDGVLASCADNGTIKFWDYKTGHNFQSELTQVQPGSLEAEAGIFASTFDKSGSRFITCEADKTIKFWKEDPNATPETHPVTDWDRKK
jgi:pleiotropic regulator 1